LAKKKQRSDELALSAEAWADLALAEIYRATRTLAPLPRTLKELREQHRQAVREAAGA